LGRRPFGKLRAGVPTTAKRPSTNFGREILGEIHRSLFLSNTEFALSEPLVSNKLCGSYGFCLYAGFGGVLFAGFEGQRFGELNGNAAQKAVYVINPTNMG